MRLKDKVILVTGSTTGIGEGMARAFVREGAKVMIHGTREETAALLAAELGANVAFVTGLLDDPAVPGRIIAEVIARFGRIDGLVNNAASTVRGNIDTTDVALFDRIIAINLRAPFLLVQAAMPHFRRQGGGRVINIGSINAYCGEPNLLAYSVSKGGLMTLTRNLADSYGREGLRVNQFNVGWTLTPNEHALKVREGLPDNWPSKVSPVYAPSGRLLLPKDIAFMAIYFLSDEAPLINGTVLEFEQFPIIGRNPPRVSEELV